MKKEIRDVKIQKIPARRRAVAATTILISAAMVLSACGGGAQGKADAEGEGGDLGTLSVVTVVPNSNLFMGVQAAERLGTWEGTGLTVKVIDGSSPTAGQIMASGDADIGLTDGVRAAANIAEGLDATVVASCYSPWAQMIVVGSGSDAKDVADLKGANFGISGEGSGGHYSVVKLAESLGWSENDYTVTPLGNIQAISAALKSGAIDAFPWSATTAFNIEERGEGRVLAATEDIVGPNVFEAFSVMDDVAAKRPKAVKAFFEGYFKAIEKLQADPQLAIDIMVEDWEVNKEAARRATELELPKLSSDGTISPEELKGVARSAEFATGNAIDDPGSLYTYWKNLAP
jgi:ABC-type nitrate/sulfonate/bicarbonate transport system substrate-binding protein